ncbi:chorismate--pyruvate lyase family protein [Sedimenticola thiotaurini]|uniref:Probable chorismate pyruvate-lyase n=1 Tax=Sedimenticola thiotaurini TaxID=1543721 RepID=A0A0F7JW21_9GAMM|nr:chorismate lyase [Sedimenticola thiotaurini]AKH20701.1 chorismate--pyruvate lyase [Sedimenticola thiotaurini]
MKYFYSRREPNWSPWCRFRYQQVPVGMAHWLRYPGSLTARLKQAAQGNFRLRLLRQGWARPLESERRLLGMRRGGVVILREVEMLCGDVPWVFARTLIPVHSLRGRARRLTLLEERPLGEVLFSDPTMRRGVTQMAQLRPGHSLFASATCGLQSVQTLWGRRTLYHLAGKPLLVNELFLPDIPTSRP